MQSRTSRPKFAQTRMPLHPRTCGGHYPVPTNNLPTVTVGKFMLTSGSSSKPVMQSWALYSNYRYWKCQHDISTRVRGISRIRRFSDNLSEVTIVGTRFAKRWRSWSRRSWLSAKQCTSAVSGQMRPCKLVTSCNGSVSHWWVASTALAKGGKTQSWWITCLGRDRLETMHKPHLRTLIWLRQWESHMTLMTLFLAMPQGDW